MSGVRSELRPQILNRTSKPFFPVQRSFVKPVFFVFWKKFNLFPFISFGLWFRFFLSGGSHFTGSVNKAASNGPTWLCLRKKTVSKVLYYLQFLTVLGFWQRKFGVFAKNFPASCWNCSPCDYWEQFQL